MDQPAQAQKEPDNLMDMENDKLDLESNIRKEKPAPVVNPVPPHQEEEIEDDDEKEAFSSHEDKEEEDGTSREDGQEKKRKRDAKFEDKHPTD